MNVKTEEQPLAPRQGVGSDEVAPPMRETEQRECVPDWVREDTITLGV
jgi:hypothetical protein